MTFYCVAELSHLFFSSHPTIFWARGLSGLLSSHRDRHNDFLRGININIAIIAAHHLHCQKAIKLPTGTGGVFWDGGNKNPHQCIATVRKWNRHHKVRGASMVPRYHSCPHNGSVNSSPFKRAYNWNIIDNWQTIWSYRVARDEMCSWISYRELPSYQRSFRNSVIFVSYSAVTMTIDMILLLLSTYST